MTFSCRLAVVACALSFMGLQSAAAPPQAARDGWLRIETVSSPAGESSSAPQLTGEGDRTILSWMERGNPRTLFKFAERTSSGWSVPKTVASGNDLLVNAADVPSVRPLAGGTLAAAWMLASSPDPEAYDLVIAWSRDNGATWSKPVRPYSDRSETQHGFASTFPAPGGGFGVVWLDGRAMNPKLAKPGDNMSLRAALFSRAGARLSDTAVDTRVCECCPTSIAIGSEGPIVAFRNRSDQEVRDIFVSRFAAGRWSAPTAVHNDGWTIEACPVNGPSVAARGRDVAVGWFTAIKDEGKAFMAFSRDGGRTFGQPVRVDEGSAIGHLDVEWLTEGSAAVSWMEFANQRQQFKARRVEVNGGLSGAVTIAGAGDARVAGHPRLARDGTGLVFAWAETEGGRSRVRTARGTF